jgi:hypothetical protein
VKEDRREVEVVRPIRSYSAPRPDTTLKESTRTAYTAEARKKLQGKLSSLLPGDPV